MPPALSLLASPGAHPFPMTRPAGRRGTPRTRFRPTGYAFSDPAGDRYAIPAPCRTHPPPEIDCFVEGWRARHPEVRGGEWHDVHCRSLRCRRDARRQQAHLERAIGALVREGYEWFVSLTNVPSMTGGCSPCETLPVHASSWNRLRPRLERRGMGGFVHVKELTAVGSFHGHLAVALEDGALRLTREDEGAGESVAPDSEAGKALLRRLWWEATRMGSYIVHVTRITSATRAAEYVAKYLSAGVACKKGEGDGSPKRRYPKGCRRYSTSRNVRLRKPNEHVGWEIETPAVRRSTLDETRVYPLPPTVRREPRMWWALRRWTRWRGVEARPCSCGDDDCESRFRRWRRRRLAGPRVSLSH